MGDAEMAAKEALRMLSAYLPAKHQSEKAHTVYLAVKAAFEDLERRLAATVEERDCWKDGGETLAMQVKDLQHELDQWVKTSAVSQRRIETLERQLAETRATLTRIALGTEAQARVMRDPIRTGGWAGAERVADAFDDIAERARTTLQKKGPPG